MAGAAVGVVFLLSANSSQEDADQLRAGLSGPNACGAGTPYASECAALHDKNSDVDRARTIEIVGFSVAGAAAIGTAVYLLWPHRHSQVSFSPTLSLSPSATNFRPQRPLLALIEPPTEDDMKLKRFSIGTLGLLAVSGLAWSCSGKSEDCDANLNCGPYGGGAVGTSGASGASGASGSNGKAGASGASAASGTAGVSGASGTSGEGGTDAASGSGGTPAPPCDGSLSPDADACVISDEFGIFVSPDGNDATADGTQAHPFATLTPALASISTIKHVYLCAGDYSEPSTIEIPDRVSIYGRFRCAGGTWTYDSPYPAHLMPRSPIGAMITDAKIGVVLQDLRIDAMNAAEDGTGASSFGMIISGSQNIALKGVEIRAGKGGKGKAGRRWRQWPRWHRVWYRSEWPGGRRAVIPRRRG